MKRMKKIFKILSAMLIVCFVLSVAASCAANEYVLTITENGNTYTAVIKVGDQSWVCIRSASCPRDFVVEKTILPSAISRKMQPRVLDFSSGSDIFLDSTSNYSSVLYVNVRPYIKADVIIE